MSTTDTIKTVAVCGAAALAAYVGYQALKLGKGVITGDNAVTRGATDASGKKTDAYVNVPVLGTVGAVTNAASGGYLASFGSWLGTSLFDVFNSDAGKVANAPTGGPTTASYDETDRLMKRYPAPSGPDTVYAGTANSSFSDIARLGSYSSIDGISFFPGL